MARWSWSAPHLAVMVIATEPGTRPLELKLAGELAAAGAAVLVVSQDGDCPRAPRPSR
jgi:fructoselysine-6-P-deglycase FrlB-like protein